MADECRGVRSWTLGWKRASLTVSKRWRKVRRGKARSRGEHSAHLGAVKSYCTTCPPDQVVREVNLFSRPGPPRFIFSYGAERAVYSVGSFPSLLDVTNSGRRRKQRHGFKFNDPGGRRAIGMRIYVYQLEAAAPNLHLTASSSTVQHSRGP